MVTQVESYGLRKQSYTGKIRSFTTVFRRITCDRITIVYLRNCIRSFTTIYGETRGETETIYRSRIRRQ